MANGKSVEDLIREGQSVTARPVEPPPKREGDLISSSLIRGGAGLLGLPGDLMGLLGKGAEWAGRKAGLNIPEGAMKPELPFGSANITGAVERVTGTPLYKPQGGEGYLSSAIEGGTAGAPGGLPGVLMGGAAGLGGQAAADLLGEGPLQRIGGAAATIPIVSSFLRRGPTVGALTAGANVVNDVAGQAGPAVNKLVNSQLRQSVQGTPNAAQNIDEALALSAKIPGFNPSVAESAGSKGALELQRRFAQSSPAALNSEIARTERNAAAIQRYYESQAPSGAQPSSVRSGVNQALSGEAKAQDATAQGIAAQLPRVDQLGTGERLTALAGKEKASAGVGIRQAYDEAFEAAGTGKVDITPVVSKVEEILGTTLSQIKPESAPQTVRKIQALFAKTEPELTGRAIPEDILAMKRAEAGTASQVTLRDADEIRKAINQDIASAGMSTNPAAATQLRNLHQVHSVIDDVVKGSGLSDEAKGLYQGALDKYRTEFAPRFKEGANLRVFKDTSLNEPRILPDKFVSEFFKPDSQGGITRTLQFTRLFGNNVEAKGLAQSGIMDIYRQKAVNPTTGAIDPTQHNAFMRDYGRTLEAMKENGVNSLDQLKRIGAEAIKTDFAGKRLGSLAQELKFETVDDLVSAALKSPKVMGNVVMRLTPQTKETFTRLVMDRAMESGTGAGISKFVGENEKMLRMAGVSEKHLGDVKDIAKAFEIAERAPLKGGVNSAGPDIIKNATGLSAATVYAQIRATTAGRQAPVTAAVNMAMPVLNKLSQTRFTDIMENALHNPQTARDLRDFLRSTPAEAPKLGQRLLDGLRDAGNVVWSAKGPILKHVVGVQNYAPNAARVAVPAATQALQERH